MYEMIDVLLGLFHVVAQYGLTFVACKRSPIEILTWLYEMPKTNGEVPIDIPILLGFETFQGLNQLRKAIAYIHVCYLSIGYKK